MRACARAVPLDVIGPRAMRGCLLGRGIGVEIGTVEVQWVGRVVVVCFHFSAWAAARRGATEGARRSECRVVSDIVCLCWGIVFLGVCMVFFWWFGGWNVLYKVELMKRSDETLVVINGM